jgi:hypothetical protein
VSRASSEEVGQFEKVERSSGLSFLATETTVIFEDGGAFLKGSSSSSEIGATMQPVAQSLSVSNN